MIEMQPGRRAPNGEDPKSPWWLCARCYRDGLRSIKLGDADA